MPYQVPPAVNYPTPLVAVASIVRRAPPDGERMVPVEILWGSMGGASHCVAINLQNNATLNFSQIAALSVDNSECGSDVRFSFPDTAETITVPAYTPKLIIEVFTSQTQFYVQSGIDGEAVANTDITRFSILNFVPPPIAVPTTVEQEAQVLGNIVASGAANPSTGLIGAGQNGTIEAIAITRNSPIVTTGTQSWSIVDGGGKVIATGTFDATAGQSHNDVLLTLNPMHVRFSNGLNFTQAGVNVGGTYSVNVLFRTP